MAHECDCKDWKQQMKVINDMTIFVSTHNGHAIVTEIKPFKHCPWCGKEV